MEFHERLVELRKERGFTRDGFAEYLGISKYTLRNYELGKTEPGHVFLKYLANVFKVSVDYLLCTTDDRTPYNKTPAYTTQEIEHIKKYRSLDDYGKDIIDTILEKESARCEDEYVEIAARGGKYKVKREALIELAKRLDAEPYEEDHDLC